MTMHLQKPWEYVSRDMNWSGAMIGLVILGSILADLQILGRTTEGYVGVALIVVVFGAVLRLTASRRGCAR
jgi:hypothetical protein